jgi:nucleoside-diphosphate-sugar epimerase
MKILITGGCGYKGSILVPKLLKLGHEVKVIDTQWFGNELQDHIRLKNIKKDVRMVNNSDLKDIDTIIHLSSVANDPCGDLNPKLTWEISALATMQLADKAKRCGIKQFIFASSGSVYGVKEEEQVTEDLELNPISEYNKTKMVSERALLSYSNDMVVQIIRPATVCGYSPRMRLDVAVNALTISALEKNKIIVHGGSQIRPNIHIDDITDLYIFLLEKKPEVSGVFNAGFENLSILEIADKVKSILPSEIIIEPTNDPRSYRINSDKILKLGFNPKKTVNDAIGDIIDLYNKRILKNEERYYNLRWMQKNNLAG